MQKIKHYQSNGGGIKTVDAHSLLHRKVSKAEAACDAADLTNGNTMLVNPTLRLVAFAFGISVWSVIRAQKLTPEQRNAVRTGQRPLVIPKRRLAPNPLVGPIPAIDPVINSVLDPHQLLDQVVAQIGLNATLDQLAIYERGRIAA
jgi:hypothetical protein